MASTSQTLSSLPKCFSVYQPTLGAPLQFFPALGSQELDDMINVFSPGPSSAGEKRATSTLDFFKHVQMTGQTFKFYPVSVPSAIAPPSTASPSMDSANFSFNVSPITSSWDWSATSVSSIASSSRVSSQRRREPKTSSRPSRHQTNDVWHLPGMKILTKDGLDVTDSASRGSKTKEQRDHAHLMRVIKACDNCRRKKIRCDPSHKKRGAAQVAPQSTPKPTKKARTVSSESVPPCHLPITTTNPEIVFPASSSFDQDLIFSFTGLEDFDPTALAYDPFDEFVQFPPMDTPDFDFLLDTTDYNSSQSSSSSSSSAASPLKSVTPSSQQDADAPTGAEFVNPELQARKTNFPFLEHSGSSSDYTDFNLFSPSSSFSEDERMLPISSLNSSLPNLNEPSLSEFPQPSLAAATNGEAIEWSDSAPSIDELQFHSANSVGGRGHSPVHNSVQLTTRCTLGESGNESYSSLNTTTLSESVGEGVLRCPPDIAVVDGDISSGGQTLANVPLSFESSAASVSLDVRPSASPGVLIGQAVIAGTPYTASPIGSVLPIGNYDQFGPVSTDRHRNALPAELGHQSAPVAAYRTHSDMPTPADQSHVVESSESIRSGSHVLSSADANAPRQSSTNRPTNLTVDDASSASQDRTHLIDTGHRTSEATDGLADGTQGVVSSSLEDCNDPRFQLPGSADSTYALASGALSQGVLIINSRGLDIGGDAGPSALSSPPTGTDADLYDGSFDRSTCGTSTPISQAIVAQPLVTCNVAANSPVTLSDTETLPITPAPSKADLASFQTAVQLAKSFTAMSSLVLYVLVATITVAKHSVETRARLSNMKQQQPLEKFHRAMSRRSALGLRVRLTPVSSLCAA